jgi:DNA-binding response OmpR family regulator
MTATAQPTLLLAEDDTALRDLLMLALSQAGWHVLYAADGIAALELARQARPQVMLLDILLPKLNGLDVLRAIKKQAGFEQLPIIVMSELAFRETVQQAIRCGAQAFIVKPFAVQDVLDKVQRAMQEPVRQATLPAPAERPAQVRAYRPPTYKKPVPNQAMTG